MKHRLVGDDVLWLQVVELSLLAIGMILFHPSKWLFEAFSGEEIR